MRGFEIRSPRSRAVVVSVRGRKVARTRRGRARRSERRAFMITVGGGGRKKVVRVPGVGNGDGKGNGSCACYAVRREPRQDG